MDDPISSLDLESKFNDFSIHSDNLRLVHEQAVPKAFQKLAVQHATAALGEESSFLSTWQPKLRIISQDSFTSDVEVDTIPFAGQDSFTSNVDLPYSYPEAFNMTSASAYARFNALATRFNTDGSDLFNLQEGIDYHTAVKNFSTLLIGLDGSDLNFLMDYTTLDETKVLFLFLKLLKLGPFLNSPLILSLYKPGAFIAFLEASIYEARKHMARSMWQNSVNERSAWATWYDSTTIKVDARAAAFMEELERARTRGAAA